MTILFLGALLTAALATAASNEIDDAAYHITAPHPFSTPLTVSVDTPWGPATMSQWTSADPAGVSYVFSTFAFRSARQLPSTRLREARTFFLHNRKCVATDQRSAPMPSEDGKLWPQATFAGNCAAGETFRTVTLIARDRLYQLQAMVRVGYAQRASDPATSAAATPASEPRTLDEALARFVRGCRFEATH